MFLFGPTTAQPDRGLLAAGFMAGGAATGVTSVTAPPETVSGLVTTLLAVVVAGSGCATGSAGSAAVAGDVAAAPRITPERTVRINGNLRDLADERR
jgi:hypothetical protein